MATKPAISSTTARNLGDKLYERRKLGALEIEHLVKEHIAQQQTNNVLDIITALRHDFIGSTSNNSRKGGLIAMAAIALGLGEDSIAAFITQIVPPVLSCFADPDQKVRYYACESLFNITKVSRGHVLPFFNEIFDTLCQLAADPDKSVKDGAVLLDHLLKDIITKKNDNFNMDKFIPLLSERVRVTAPECRKFIISWIQTFDKVPGVDMLKALPHFLDGIFIMLADRNEDIRQSVETCLAEFLVKIKITAAIWEKIEAEKAEQKEEAKETETSVETKDIKEQEHSQTNEPKPNEDNSKKKTDIETEKETETTKESNSVSTSQALEEPKETQEMTSLPPSEIENTNEKSKETENKEPEITPQEAPTTPESTPIIKKTPSNPITPPTPLKFASYRSASSLVLNTGSTKLPVIRFGSIVKILLNHSRSRDELSAVTSLQWLFEFIVIGKEKNLPFVAAILDKILPQISHKNDQIEKTARNANGALHKIVKKTNVEMVVKDILSTLCKQFKNSWVPTRLSAVRWVNILHTKSPNELVLHLDVLFPALLKLLSDPAEEVVRVVLNALAKFSTNETYFVKLISSLIELFRNDRKLLELRTGLIIRQLALHISPEKICRCCSEILEHEEDPDFASTVIQILNLALLTSIEMQDLRNRLKSLNSNETRELFTVLYKSWCHNQAAVFSLCLLAEMYEHASNLVYLFAQFEMSVPILAEIDKLVQLIESPIFMSLRLHLLEPDKYPYLFKCLYGLLMLLPQTSAFVTLRGRLSCVSSLGVLQLVPKSPDAQKPPPQIDFQNLLDHFFNVQKKHQDFRKALLNQANESILLGPDASKEQNNKEEKDTNEHT